jgi:oxygen-independent coproporphyrinogen-3 oxidase
MKALAIQLKYELNRFELKNKEIESIFIGGGTPSTVDSKYYETIFNMLKPFMLENIEITTEANPNSATKSWLSGMKRLGVNRISFGVQSFNDKKLKLLNRAHSSDDALRAINNASKIGFKNISLDLIYATYGDTKKLLEYDIDTALSLPINHMSAYALTIEEGTPFETKPKMSKENIELTNWLFEEIAKRGLPQYEISNFGVYQSIHNLGYWQYKDYIGLGSGAVGKLDLNRFYPSTDIQSYIDNPLKIRVESLDIDDKRLEQIFLGFRSNVGVDKYILTKEEQKRAKILVQEKKLTLKGAKFYNLQYLLADEITLFISS